MLWTYTAQDGYIYPLWRSVMRPPLCSSRRTWISSRYEKSSAIERHGGRYVVKTGQSVFQAEQAVNAGGPRAAKQIGRMVGIDVPVEAMRR